MSDVNMSPALHGEFDEWKHTGRNCPKCKQPTVYYREWESSDGAYEDYQYRCRTPECKHSWWVDGIDS